MLTCKRHGWASTQSCRLYHHRAFFSYAAQQRDLSFCAGAAQTGCWQRTHPSGPLALLCKIRDLQRAQPICIMPPTMADSPRICIANHTCSMFLYWLELSHSDTMTTAWIVRRTNLSSIPRNRIFIQAMQPTHTCPTQSVLFPSLYSRRHKHQRSYDMCSSFESN
ncbi:hypothetical protein EJ05DRAFT_360993 [Pseudovirgaria hyperparasitica]|uniref:Uncharacterized protein n=1 Tax=Pseudovirgaria hyperparasitica TaxID=470096 RepID=A0A6A6W708_9PEZI|nr:uncharacterized protein EJ05DRAFT_360993 [Pseudovirgaria hyperparasitica]KAF2758668.1 hypothetical protein EJ05DRAFT_360993 [Pseudovirgaria hyperparasitica]